jgi:hypothetical protein
MTPEAMIEWTAYANTHPVKNRLGRTIYLSGYNWFMKLRDTEDGILLPFGQAPPPIFVTARAYEDGPYSFVVQWPEMATDEWRIYVYFTELHDDLGYLWPLPRTKYAGSYLKPDVTDLDYAHLSAMGITFTAGHYYEIRGYIRGPRYFPSGFNLNVFHCRSTAGYSFNLTMDDEAANTTVTDDWGHHDQAFLGTNPNTEDHSVNGVHGKALHFDGSTSKIVLTDASYQAYLDVDQPFTLCLWWKPDAPVGAGYDHFLSSYNWSEPGIGFIINNSSSLIMAIFRYNGSNYSVSKSWVEVDVSIWQHWAIVRNGTNVRFFRNGILGYEATHGGYRGAMYWLGNPLSIGCMRSVSNFAAGAADDVYLFDHALSDPEVAALAVP